VGAGPAGVHTTRHSFPELATLIRGTRILVTLEVVPGIHIVLAEDFDTLTVWPTALSVIGWKPGRLGTSPNQGKPLPLLSSLLDRARAAARDSKDPKSKSPGCAEFVASATHVRLPELSMLQTGHKARSI
jgi:hypothetical protein